MRRHLVADLPDLIPYAREPRKLPVALSADEVVRFLEAVPSLKALAALTTAYAAGLRASEAASLKFANIDSSRIVIRVEQRRKRVRRGVHRPMAEWDVRSGCWSVAVW